MMSTRELPDAVSATSSREVPPAGAKQLRIMTPLLEGILSKVTAEESALDAPHQATSAG
jgi:hypothetical protein